MSIEKNSLYYNVYITPFEKKNATSEKIFKKLILLYNYFA